MPEIILNESIEDVLEKVFDYRNEQGLQIFSVGKVEYCEGRKDMPEVKIPYYKEIEFLEKLSQGFGEYVVMHDSRSILNLTADYEKGNTTLYFNRSWLSRQGKIGYEILKNLLGF